MKKMVALTLALLMAASLFLSGCSVRKDTSDSENSGSSNGSGSGDRVVNVCSWGEYIDESLIDQFEEATGIKVNYQTAESNEVLYSQLSMGGVDYDVIVPSDYMISQLIEEDMLAELNYDNIPNFEKIDDRFKNLSYDPENKYTVPYTWGTLGIIYNTAKVQEPITSWSAMFDPQYAGNVLLINNSRDALGIALLYLGYSVNTTDEAEIQEAYQLIADAVKNGVYQGKVMDEVFQKMDVVTIMRKGDYTVNGRKFHVPETLKVTLHKDGSDKLRVKTHFDHKDFVVEVQKNDDVNVYSFASKRARGGGLFS